MCKKSISFRLDRKRIQQVFASSLSAQHFDGTTYITLKFGSDTMSMACISNLRIEKLSLLAVY